MSTYSWGPYKDPTSCFPQVPQGAKATLLYMKRRFPWITSMGICNCRDVRGGNTMSHHGPCWAVDLGIPTNDGAYIPKFGDPIIETLGPYGQRLGYDHLILNRRIYSRRSNDGRYYGGVHPHKNHAHLGLTAYSAANLNYSTLVSVLGHPGSQLPIEDDMETIKAIQIQCNVGGFKGANGKVLTVDGLLGDNTQYAMNALARAASQTGGNLNRGDSVKLV